MSHVCFFTGKKTGTGWVRAEKGARRDGGVGNKIKGRTKRKVKANLKKLRILVDGVVRKEWVSTEAIKRGFVVKPLKVKVAAKAK
jgi:ribosomal protein L28